MREQKNITVNGRHFQKARERTGQASDINYLQDSLLDPADAESLPYLEQAMNAARKYPYAALGAMIAVAGIVVAAIVTISVSVFTGLFLMYGTMRETTTNQIQIQATLVAMQKQQNDDKQQIANDMNAIRAYESNRSRRTEFIVGLMSPERQRILIEWDKVNPAPELPTTKEKKE